MDGCGCDGLTEMFNRRTAEHDRDRYRRHGPDRTTRMLLDLIRSRQVEGSTILDIGGGIGLVDTELLRAGANRAVIVDVSPAYLDVARDEARLAGVSDRVEFVQGDFVCRAEEIGPADIVTLDRVVCCYPDAESLVGLSAARARRIYGLVLPRDRWLVRIVIGLVNLGYRIRRRAYRAYAHSNARIDQLVAADGLEPRAEDGTFLWRVVVYERVPSAPT